MKTILIYSIVTLLLVSALSAFSQAFAPSMFNSVVNGQQVLMVKGKVENGIHVWLTIEAYNGQQWAANGFEPTYTRVVSDYKPMFRHLPNGQWEMMFVKQ